MDGSMSAEPRLRDKERGQGLSSDGIHTEDVEIDIVRGEQSFQRFPAGLPLNTPQGRHRIRDCKHISDSER